MTKKPPYRTGTAKPEERMAFAAWLIDPDREPRTQTEYAELHGLSRSTLSEWRKSPDVVAILEGWRASYSKAFVRVMDAAFQKAIRGDVSAMRFLADVLGMNSPQRIEQTIEELSVRYTKPEALRELATGVLAKAQGLEKERHRDN
jgi:hypothetical protein